MKDLDLLKAEIEVLKAKVAVLESSKVQIVYVPVYQQLGYYPWYQEPHYNRPFWYETTCGGSGNTAMGGGSNLQIG